MTGTIDSNAQLMSSVKKKLDKAQLVVIAISRSVNLDPSQEVGEDLTPTGDMFNLFEIPRDLLIEVANEIDAHHVGYGSPAETEFETELFRTANYFEMARRMAGTPSDNLFDRGNCAFSAEDRLNYLAECFNKIDWSAVEKAA